MYAHIFTSTPDTLTQTYNKLNLKLHALPSSAH